MAANRAWLLVGLAAVVAYVSWFTWALEHRDYQTWGTLMIGPLLVVVSVPLLGQAVRREPDRRIGALIVGAFFLKLAMAFVNHAVAFGIYGGVADARGYHGAGTAYSEAFRAGHFALSGDAQLGRRFISAVTGALYTITGPSKLVGYLVFSWFAFWGLYLFYRAFVLAVPEGDRRRYALLVFLLPSTLFWTSAIGKEAWMTLALGTCAVGAARLLTHRRGGMPVLALGLAGSALCRPHISFMVLMGVAGAYLLRRSATPKPLGPLVTIGGLFVLVAIGSALAGQFARHFELTSFGTQTSRSVLEVAERESEIGRSAFSVERTPWPLAVPGVLVRPLPFEAHNAQALAASFEGTAMLVLLAASRRRVAAAARRIVATSYLAFCATSSILFLVAFSVFRNFGILARERVQLLPFVLVLLALPAAQRSGPLRRFGPPPLGAGPETVGAHRRA
ncbi:MAG: hypothetical protein ACRD03_06115 [Acidimicrobiales bacterium]